MYEKYRIAHICFSIYTNHITSMHTTAWSRLSLSPQDHTARIRVGIVSNQKNDLNEIIENKSSAIKKLSRKRKKQYQNAFKSISRNATHSNHLKLQFSTLPTYLPSFKYYRCMEQWIERRTEIVSRWRIWCTRFGELFNHNLCSLIGWNWGVTFRIVSSRRLIWI